jgi:hypothetical protein
MTNLVRNTEVDGLLAEHARHRKAFENSRLVRLMDDPRIALPATRAPLLACLQAWSDHFQTLLHLRMAHTRDPAHASVAAEHLAEEFGHNANLRRQCGGDIVELWDPTIEAVSQWFRAAMQSGTDVEKTLIMHMVIETSAEAFFIRASDVFPDIPHFRGHAEDDGEHADIGVALVSQARVDEIEALKVIHARSWKMMTLLCDRMAEIALESAQAA